MLFSSEGTQERDGGRKPEGVRGGGRSEGCDIREELRLTIQPMGHNIEWNGEGNIGGKEPQLCSEERVFWGK